jgi:hypothetical protein
MTAKPDEYLNADELRHLTGRATSQFQIDELTKLGVPFSLDRYEYPLVLYRDAVRFFIQLGKPLPR